jgi:hypothetical protein
VLLLLSLFSTIAHAQDSTFHFRKQGDPYALRGAGDFYSLRGQDIYFLRPLKQANQLIPIQNTQLLKNLGSGQNQKNKNNKCCSDRCCEGCDMLRLPCCCQVIPPVYLDLNSIPFMFEQPIKFSYIGPHQRVFSHSVDKPPISG